MYEELNCFEEALKHFGTRVEVICAMELGGRITAEDAYQMVKEELKQENVKLTDAIYECEGRLMEKIDRIQPVIYNISNKEN